MREQQAARQEPAQQQSLLEQIPVDAPMDDATITVWNGERFVAYDKWLAHRPVATEEKQATDEKKPDVRSARAKKAEQEGLW